MSALAGHDWLSFGELMALVESSDGKDSWSTVGVHESLVEASWQALASLLPEDLFVIVHLTLTPQNTPNVPATLQRLASLGVQNLSASVIDLSLRPELETLAQQAADLHLTLRFDLPVPYSEQNPVALETQPDRLPSGAGKAWLYVEPDGDVLPAQGMADRVLSNFLRDGWEKIHPG